MDEFGYFYFKDRTGDTYRFVGILSTQLILVQSNFLQIIKLL